MIFARYFRGWKYYLVIHALIFIVIDVLNIVFISMTIYNVGAGQGRPINYAHNILGIIFFSLVTFNVVLGAFVYNSLTHIYGVLVQKIWDFHKYLAYFLWVLGKVLIILGEAIFNEKNREKSYVKTYIIISMLILRIIIEIIFMT